MKNQILTLLAFLSFALGAHAESYVSNHSKMISVWDLVLPAVVHGRPYVSAGLALEIVEVRVDGVPQAPTEDGLAREDSSVYPEPVDAVIYETNSEYLSVSRWKDGRRQAGLLIKYSLPNTAKRIDIRYIIHIPDGSRSNEITMTSFELNDLRENQLREKQHPNQPPRMPVSGTPAADAPVAPAIGRASS